MSQCHRVREAAVDEVTVATLQRALDAMGRALELTDYANVREFAIEAQASLGRVA